MPRGDGYFRRWPVVVCVASGPSLDADQCTLIEVARARGACKVIVVNECWRLLPRANALYACDPLWWTHRRPRQDQFEGERWTQIPEKASAPDRAASIEVAAAHGLNWITSIAGHGLGRDPRYLHTGSNSGYQAIGLAYHFGAEKIVLAGYDMQNGANNRSHWHGDHPQPLHQAADPKVWVDRFGPLAIDLKTDTVDVVNCTLETALRCFARADLAATLEGLE